MRTFLFLGILFLTARTVNAQSKFKTGGLELDADLNQINVYAQTDYGRFKTELEGTYHISDQRIEYFHTHLKMEPADIYFALEISRVSNRHVDDVVEIYKTNRAKGWGKVTKELGIKPGSSAFHQLKDNVRNKSSRGNANATSNGSGKEKHNHNKGKGKGN